MKEKDANKNVIITIPEELRTKLLEEANKVGLGLSPYIRMILFKEMSRITTEEKYPSSYKEDKAV